MTRVLITRPEPGGSRTLNALLARKVDAVSIALTAIQPLHFHAPDTDFEALIITSQNAIVHGATLLALHKSKLVFAVGQRTAEALRGLNHNHVEWAETAHDLVPRIIAHQPNRVLYVCGQTRRPELEIGLTAAGISVEAIEVYKALKAENLYKKLQVFFASTTNSIILFHAPSAVEAFVSAINNQNLHDKVRFLCMSAAIAEDLPENWQKNAIIAKRPDDAAMLDQLYKMLA